MEQTRSQRFIQEYARLMKSSAEFFNKDSVLMSREDYDNAKLRVLVVFPSPASTKAVSMTAAVLNDYVISSCPGVFIDFAYVPEQDDLKYYDKANMPYAIGNVTHLDASHFDIVGFSISILFESISVAWIMNSFTRCDKPLPLTWSERKDKKLSEVPVFYAGGITCSVADILFGELGDGRQAFLDYLHLGEFHCSKLLFDHYLVSREKGRTVQEMIDSFWKEVDFNDWLYQPQAYQVEFNDKNQIVKNVKINPNAPDMCKPYYPDEMPKEMGAARGIVMGNGVNAGLGQILAANGCSRSGFCNFSVAGNTMLGTVYGLVPIENLVDKGCQKLQSAGVVTCKDILRQKDERVYRVTLESGVYLDCSSGHKWIRAIDHKKGNKEKTYTTRQLANIVNKGGEFVVLRKIGNHFGVEWHSDLKVINLREESMLSQDEKCYQYTVSSPYHECCEMINDLVVRLNFYGFDTGVLRYQDKTIIEWWPMPNCATYDRVVAVEALAEVVPMYDVFDTDDHTVCYNGVITHQCHEGAYTGGWVENTPERLVELAKLCRKHTASTTLKAYSFNSNYLSDYKRNIFDWLGVYPRVTFNNMRLEELGLDKDALKMMKLAGYQRMTAPLEGISERIRNNLLNKNLSEKALDSYLEYGMMMGAVDCKVGIVLTGYEEEQDWQAFYDFNMKWRKKCHDMGGNIPFRYKCTLAVHYPHCLTEEALTPYPGTGLLRQNEHKLGKVAGFEDSEVTEVSEPFVQKAYTLTTTRGQQITGNFEHPVLTSPFGGGKWELMGNLKKGQTIYMKIGTKCYGDFKYVKFERPMGNRAKIKKLDFCLNPRWAEVLGWYCGDGFIHEGESLQFGLCYNKSEREILERHREVLETMFFDVSVHEYDSIDKLVVNSTLLCEWVKKEFGSKFDGKKISKLILTSPEVVQSSFLRGVFSADGTCGDYKEGSSIRLGMSNEQFIRDVQAMLMNMGIDCCVSVSRSGRKNPKWSCHVRRQYIIDYLELIGFQGQKSVRGLSTAKLGKHSDLGFIRVKVRSVEEVGERTLWGLTVNNHAYVTNGIVSHNTPIEYIERRAAKHAYYGTYIMPNEWNDKYYQDHIRIKLNGFKHSTFIEQAIVDLGRYATPWMYNYIIRPGYPFYNTKTIVTHEEAWEAFKGMINPDYFFNERKMDEYISICHRIHIAMHANVIFQAKKILKDGANATPTIRCLKTYEGCPVDCKAHVYGKSPLITFGDAWLDETGKLTGKVWEEVKGCQRCKTPADRKKVLARELPMSKNADDILMYKAPSLELRLRFRIQRKKEYEVLSPRNTAFVFFTKFLRKSEELCKMFWELDAYHNMFWQSEEDKTYVVSGQQIVDVTFTDRKAKELVENLIQEVNAEAKSFRVVSVREAPLTDKIKVDDYNVFYFESTLSAEFWQFAAMNYDGEVKVEGAQGAMETIKDVRLTAPSFTLRDKVKGYFTVPCKYSPWHYLQGLMAVRRISLSKLLATTSIQCITTVRESNGTCMCGKEKAVSDIGTNMQQKVGRDCLAAFLTSKL